MLKNHLLDINILKQERISIKFPWQSYVKFCQYLMFAFANMNQICYTHTLREEPRSHHTTPVKFTGQESFILTQSLPLPVCPVTLVICHVSHVMSHMSGQIF